MTKLDYEPKPEEYLSIDWQGALPVVLFAIACWPWMLSLIVSAHGLSSTDMRLIKLFCLLGFLAAYGLTRLKRTGWLVVGCVLLVPYTILIAATGWQVVQALVSSNE